MGIDNKNLDSWDKYVTNFLKVADVADNNTPLVCIGVDEVEVDSKLKVRLTLEKDSIEYSFDLNATNARKLKELKVENPKKCIGKKFYFDKVKVNNPSTNKMVDSLYINRIE